MSWSHQSVNLFLLLFACDEGVGDPAFRRDGGHYS